VAPFTDHIAVTAWLNLGIPFSFPGRRYWKMNISLLDDKNVMDRFKHYGDGGDTCVKITPNGWRIRETDEPTHDNQETQTLPTENSTHTNRTHPLPTDEDSSGRKSAKRCAKITEQRWTVIYTVSMNTIIFSPLKPLSQQTDTATHTAMNSLHATYAMQPLATHVA
jgi:hypothetical protein